MCGSTLAEERTLTDEEQTSKPDVEQWSDTEWEEWWASWQEFPPLPLAEKTGEPEGQEAVPEEDIQAWNFKACPSLAYRTTNDSLEGRFTLHVTHSAGCPQVVLGSRLSGSICGEIDGKPVSAELLGEVQKDASLLIQVKDIVLATRPYQGQDLFDHRGGFLDFTGLGIDNHAWRLYCVIAADESLLPSEWTPPEDQFMALLMGTHPRLGAQSPISLLDDNVLGLIHSFVKRSPIWEDLEDEVEYAGLHLCDPSMLSPAQLVNQYRHFLALKVEQEDWWSEKMSPPMIDYKGTRLIDEVWHVHISMDCYEDDCRLLSGGHIITHQATLGPVALERYRNTYALHLERCESLDEEIDECCWPDPDDGESSIDSAILYDGCC